MYIPLWAAFITGGLLFLGTAFGAVLVFRSKKAELGVTEEANLRDDQREYINTLKENTAAYQALLPKYAEAVTQGAETKMRLGVIEASLAAQTLEITKLRDDFQEMKTDRDNLQADRERLIEQAACVPLLNEQIGHRDKTIRQQALTLKDQSRTITTLTDKLDTTTLLLDAASRGQERVEGAASLSHLIDRLDKDG